MRKFYTNKSRYHALANASAMLFLFFGIKVLAQDIAPDVVPTGGQVVAGSVTIHHDAPSATLNVNQTSQRAIVNWQKFDVGQNATVNFNQPNAQSSTLNKVATGSESKILGKINAPGEVILVNQSGVYFSQGSQVDVRGLVATTHNIANDDYLAGKHVYDRAGSTGRWLMMVKSRQGWTDMLPYLPQRLEMVA